MELESYSVESKGRQSYSQKARRDGVRLQLREGRAPLRRPGRMGLGCNKGKAELLSEGQAGWS